MHLWPATVLEHGHGAILHVDGEHGSGYDGYQVDSDGTLTDGLGLHVIFFLFELVLAAGVGTGVEVENGAEREAPVFLIVEPVIVDDGHAKAEHVELGLGIALACLVGRERQHAVGLQKVFFALQLVATRIELQAYAKRVSLTVGVVVGRNTKAFLG